MSTVTDTLFPFTTLFRDQLRGAAGDRAAASGLPHPRGARQGAQPGDDAAARLTQPGIAAGVIDAGQDGPSLMLAIKQAADEGRPEEQTSELQSLMRMSYTVFCLKNNTTKRQNTT